MIRFALTCARGAHPFEGWFRGNAGFEERVAGGELACPVCGDRDVKKAIMAPAVARSGEGGDPAEGRGAALGQALRAMRAVREHVEAKFEDVGDRFPDEARRMHRGEIDRRDVYGRATREEVVDLLDEGVRIRPLPDVPKLDG